MLAAVPAASWGEDCPRWLPDFHCERSGRFTGFQRPIASPFLFEDPFITTGIYPTYVYHEYAHGGVFHGGHVHVAAVQARVALTDRLGFIATKDGYAWHTPNIGILPNERGFLNIAAGLKYAFWQDRDRGRIVSGVLRFEIPIGSAHVFQGFSNGTVLPSVTAAWRLGKVHLIGDLGGQIPFDLNQQTTSIFYHLYADYSLTRWLQPFIQISGQTFTTSGDGSLRVHLRGGGTIPFGTALTALGEPGQEGADVLNLGSPGIAGTTQLAIGGGIHIPLTKHVTWSTSYEANVLNDNQSLYRRRVITALTLEF